jgi:hypothetical protein
MKVATKISSFIMSLVVGSMVFQQQSHADVVNPGDIIWGPWGNVIFVIILVVCTGVVIAAALVLDKIIKKNRKAKKK